MTAVAAAERPTPSPSGATAGSPPGTSGSGMSHRQILEALSGLLLAMFVAMLSSTVVSNALPRIVADLHGSETSYTWVVTATLLAMTASTPLWGKLSDLVSRKLLMQIAIVIYIAGSMAAGLSQSAGFLIACRAIQGAGAGGVLALTQVILAAMVSPRERGRYSGYLGAVFAIATISGPLLGGVIVDTSWLGWRWCFYVGAPVAVVALVVLQKTLHLPVYKREAKVDYLGALLIVGGVSLLLVWVSLAGQQFDWLSGKSAGMVAGGLVLLGLAVLVETRAVEPIIPLQLFRHRTVSLATIASLFVGVALFGATIFLSQYFQIARGKSPTVSGLMTMPLILGLASSSLVVGRIITQTGKWKRFLVAGAVLVTVGFTLLGTTRYDTSLVLVGLYMAIAGLGVGMTMQNLVLSVQNSVPIRELGSATATVSFFRSLGGAIGVSALGAVLASRVRDLTASGLAAAHLPVPASGGQSESLPNVNTLPPVIRTIVESAYGQATATIFLLAVPLLVLAVVAVLLIREVPLRTNSEVGGAQASGGEAAATAAPVETPTDETVEPAAPGLHGRVQQASGAPIARAQVSLLGDDNSSGERDGQPVGTAHTDEDGAFHLSAPTGSYLLLTAAPDAQPVAQRVFLTEKPTERNVVLETAGALVGRVRRGSDGAGLGGARVLVAAAEGGVLGSTTSAEDGSFGLHGLPTGEVTVVGEHPSTAPLARSARITAGSRTLVTLDLAAGGVLTGVVRAASDDRPLRDADVTLFDGQGVPFAAAITDAEGRYTFSDVPAGDYTVTATGFGPVSRRISTGTEDGEVELRLGPSRTAIGPSLGQPEPEPSDSRR